MNFHIESQDPTRPHLPKPLLDGNTSSVSIEEVIRTRDEEHGEGDFDHMFEPGQTRIGKYFLAPFQRPEVWTTEQKVRLVESALMGVSIGSIVVVDALNLPMRNNNTLFAKTDRWLLDGQQRLSAIRDYTLDKFKVFAGSECEHVFSDLSEIEKRFVRRVQVGVIRVVTDDEDVCREIYNRLNFGGTAHTEDQRA